jgi:fumarate reductase flavoprotein subunit
VELARTARPGSERAVKAGAESVQAGLRTLMLSSGTEHAPTLRRKMGEAMEEGVGIYRDAEGLARACATIADLRARLPKVGLEDRSAVYNTELTQRLELEGMLEVAQTMAEAAQARTESRGAHQRLDHPERDDLGFLRHSLAYRSGDGPPRIDWRDVTITRSAPAARVYGGGAP